MHLSDGGGGFGVRIKGVEQLFGLPPKLLDDNPPHLFVGERRDCIPKLRELKTQLSREYVGPNRHELANLDERGSDFFACKPQLLRQSLYAYRASGQPHTRPPHSNQGTPRQHCADLPGAPHCLLRLHRAIDFQAPLQAIDCSLQ